MTDTEREVAREFVTDNKQLLKDVLRFSEDSYARACALVLLQKGGTEREVRAIREDLEVLRDEFER